MLKIALSPGFNIRMSMPGTELKLMVKSYFFLNQSFHSHCICISVVTERRDCL